MKYITKDEFDRAYSRQYKFVKTPEAEAIEGLDVLQGFVTPCRWEHKPNGRSQGSCSGISLIHQVARRNSIKISGRCLEKNLYVMRLS